MLHVADILVRLTEEQRDQAAQLAGAMGLSLNEYIRRLIKADLDSISGEELALLTKMKNRQVTAAHESRTEYKVNKAKK